jgi:hypothetical protein
MFGISAERFFAINSVSDWHLFHPEVLTEQRRQLRHWSARRAGEDCT